MCDCSVERWELYFHFHSRSTSPTLDVQRTSKELFLKARWPVSFFTACPALQRSRSSVLLAVSFCKKKLMSEWLYWSDQDTIWVSALSLLDSNTQRRSKPHNCTFQTLPTLQQSEEEGLAHPERINIFVIAVSGSSSVSFIQFLFELCKFELQAPATWLCWKNQNTGFYFILTLPLTSFSQCLSFSNKTDTEGMFLQCQSWLNGLFQSVLSFLTQNIFHALIIDLSLHFPICITNFEMEEQKHNSISNKISPSKYSGVAVFFCSFFQINPNIQMFFDGS